MKVKRFFANSPTNAQKMKEISYITYFFFCKNNKNYYKSTLIKMTKNKLLFVYINKLIIYNKNID